MEAMRHTPEQLLPTGHKQEVTPDRQRQGAKAHEDGYDYAIKSQTHMWIVILQHRATDQILDGFDGVKNELPILDVDTLHGPPSIGCYVCEQAYEPILRRRKCPGEPKS